MFNQKIQKIKEDFFNSARELALMYIAKETYKADR